MIYRWKKCLEAVQLPGDLGPMTTANEGGVLNAKKGDWLVFEDGAYIGFFSDKQFRDRAESVPLHRSRTKKVSPDTAEGRPRRGRPRGMGRSPLEGDGQEEASQ